MLSSHIDPFQFTIAFVAAGKVASDEASKQIGVSGHLDHARGECIARMEFTGQVARDSGFPVVFSFPVCRANAGQEWDVGFASKSVIHLRAEAHIIASRGRC